MRPLTLKTTKPMIKICGRPLLEHIIGALPSIVDELILVVGYLQDQIRHYFKESFGRFKITYIIQKEKLGTYHALKLCKRFLGPGERFFLIYADDLHGSRALEKCAQSEGLCSVIDENETPSKFGVVELNDDNSIKSIEEKPADPKTNLVLTGAQLLTKGVLNFPARRHPNGEYYLTDSLAQMIAAGHKIYTVKTDFWLPIGYPEDIKKAEELLQARAR